MFSRTGHAGTTGAGLLIRSHNDLRETAKIARRRYPRPRSSRVGAASTVDSGHRLADQTHMSSPSEHDHDRRVASDPGIRSPAPLRSRSCAGDFAIERGQAARPEAKRSLRSVPVVGAIEEVAVAFLAEPVARYPWDKARPLSRSGRRMAASPAETLISEVAQGRNEE